MSKTIQRQAGRFRPAGKPKKGKKKTFHVVTRRQPRVGDEIIVTRSDASTCTVVVTKPAKRYPHGGDWYAPFSDIGKDAAEKARRQGQPPVEMNMRIARKRKNRPPDPAPFAATRPSSCVGGMTPERAKIDARRRGKTWTPYHCEKCQEWHVEDTQE